MKSAVVLESSFLWGIFTLHLPTFFMGSIGVYDHHTLSVWDFSKIPVKQPFHCSGDFQ